MRRSSWLAAAVIGCAGLALGAGMQFEDVTPSLLTRPKPLSAKPADIPNNWDVIFTDLTGNGRLGILMISGTPSLMPHAIWVQGADRKFSQVSGDALKFDAGLCICPLRADNGREDLFVVGQDAGGDFLLINQWTDGKQQFDVRKYKPGSANHYAALGYLMGDGKLDYAITPGGTLEFNQILDNKSILQTYAGIGGPVYIADLENDDFPDVFVLGQQNHTHVYKEGEREALLINHKGVLTDRLMESGLGKTMALHGVAMFADLNHSGFQDIIIAGFLPSRADAARKISLFKNNGDGTFTDMTEGSGLPIFGLGMWRDNFSAGDFDNDGYIDFVINGQVWRNKGDFKFERGFDLKQVGPPYSHRQDVADYDEDGKLDIVCQSGGERFPLTIWHNTTANTNHWLDVTLQGPAGNADAVGARLTVYAAGSDKIAGSIQILKDNGHPLSRPHFGLGEIAKVDLKIHLPHGPDLEFKNIETGQRICITDDGKIHEHWENGYSLIAPVHP